MQNNKTRFFFVYNTMLYSLLLPYLHKHYSCEDSLVTYTLALTDNGHPWPTGDNFHSCQCRSLKKKTKTCVYRHPSCYLPLDDQNLISSFHFFFQLSSRQVGRKWKIYKQLAGKYLPHFNRIQYSRFELRSNVVRCGLEGVQKEGGKTC